MTDSVDSDASFTKKAFAAANVIFDATALPLRSDEHVVGLRRVVRDRAIDMKLSLVDQTKLVTAASELARNTLKYGGGGEVYIRDLSDGLARGIRLMFIDEGPGIVDVAQALTDGYTSGGGLGLGLGGSKRLVDKFEIFTIAGEGTAVSIEKWKR
ncbi:anti-sigma regulatory factor [Undibacterium sp. TJN19]|uniref:anti-sigma regulatory factor n=1 Tax=Undibacterium sp. TJN19 TaxID=3413055 RepID=UPI003BF0C0C4